MLKNMSTLVVKEFVIKILTCLKITVFKIIEYK